MATDLHPPAADEQAGRRTRWVWSVCLVLLFGAAAAVVAVVATDGDDEVTMVSSGVFQAPGEFVGPMWFEIVLPDGVTELDRTVVVQMEWGPLRNRFTLEPGDPLIWWFSKSRNLGGADNPPVTVSTSIEAEIEFGLEGVPIGARSVPDRWTGGG